MSGEFWKIINRYLKDKVLDTSRWLLEDPDDYTSSIRKETVTKYEIKKGEMLPVATFFTKLVGQITSKNSDDFYEDNEENDSEEENSQLPEISFDEIWKDEENILWWDEAIEKSNCFTDEISKLSQDENALNIVKKIFNEAATFASREPMIKKWSELKEFPVFLFEFIISKNLNYAETQKWDSQWRKCLESIENDIFFEDKELEEKIKGFLKIFEQEKERQKKMANLNEIRYYGNRASDNTIQIINELENLKEREKNLVESNNKALQDIQSALQEIKREQKEVNNKIPQQKIELGSLEKFAVYSAPVMLFILIIVNIFSSKKVKYNKI
jgi:hypothetical protein